MEIGNAIKHAYQRSEEGMHVWSRFSQEVLSHQAKRTGRVVVPDFMKPDVDSATRCEYHKRNTNYSTTVKTIAWFAAINAIASGIDLGF